ncbi:SDR family NAD(P)-dependent oxidoreductase [Cellulomonas sp. S1-8]|uniref:SDR family NAD(P)-dependent oxidoreductase n=1 Tax=Cellulomonas sp. S1-8 TaxID=2904790 RepID=UPI002243AC99|nr:SDR family NAD(P)-dependent oxidoreductase [Cellulomonas sp. S1-8]UZN03455.1 SDR family NAD(P)-dependent oxidoreductase [Cellulomonas sp. S1-8]
MHTVLLTGGTRGIGRAAATEILRRDPTTHLVLLGRASSVHPVAAELRALAPHVTPLDADLADLTSVRRAAATVGRLLDAGDLPPLRVVGANAGVQLVDALHTTPDGFETTFAVNVLANHVLLRSLEPWLRTPARVVVTVSDTHFGDLRHTGGLVPAPRWSDPATLAQPAAFPRPSTAVAGRTAYSTSKLAAVHLVHAWARHLPVGVDVLAYNPGFVPGTGLTRAASPVARFVAGRVLQVLTLQPSIDDVQTAGRRLAAALLGDVDAPTGAYVDRSRVVPPSPASYDEAREDALWRFADEVHAAIATVGTPGHPEGRSGSPV